MLFFIVVSVHAVYASLIVLIDELYSGTDTVDNIVLFSTSSDLMGSATV